MRIFISRIAKGEPGGVISSSCPIGFEKERLPIEDELKNTPAGQIDYKHNGYEDYLRDELWKHKRVRQGWGFSGLSLFEDDVTWIRNYIIGCRKYWNTPLEDFEKFDFCHDGAGRKKLYDNTLGTAKKGDILVIPTHSKTKHHDSKNLTIATVSGSYYFDLDPKYQDFGHVLPVKNVISVPYDEIIKPKNLTGYYQRAISEVLPRYKLYKPLKKFLEKHYIKT